MKSHRKMRINFPFHGHSNLMKNGTTSNSFEYYVLLFFIIAFVGWLWEVVLYLLTEHTIINRGVYRGPYLPIYGVGGLLLCLLLRSLKKHPVIVFLISMVICSLLEYFTGFFLEKRWGIRWWDYSGHFLNLQGRICLMGAIAFGLGGSLLVCFFLPLYDKVYHRFPAKWKIGITLVLLVVFVADAAYSAIRPNVGLGISEKVQEQVKMVDERIDVY